MFNLVYQRSIGAFMALSALFVNKELTVCDNLGSFGKTIQFSNIKHRRSLGRKTRSLKSRSNRRKSKRLSRV